MTGVQESPKGKLTLWQALRDLGWLPLLLMGVGGLSIIDILEQAVFDDLNLITPFQIVLDGYRRITNLIGAFVEPLLQPAFDWINAQFNWHVRLQPFWRSLFVLGMVVVTGIARTAWRYKQWGNSILLLIVMGMGAFAASVAVGLLPLSGGWWVQGLIAAAPLALLATSVGIVAAVFSLVVPSRAARARGGGAVAREALGSLLAALIIAALFGAVAFALGAGLSLVPNLGDGAGILVLSGGVAFAGAGFLFLGLRNALRDYSRVGLSILGGFIAAGLILFSNWAVTALS